MKRKSEYKIHSPFVYDFMRKVLNDHGTNRDYDTIYRIARLLDKRKHISYNQRKQSRLLYRLVRYFEPESVVSFGKLSALNTSALALGHLQTKVYLEESDDFLETLNSMGIDIVVDFNFGEAASTGDLRAIIAWGVVFVIRTIVTMVLNYVTRKLFLYRAPKNPQEVA